MTILSHRQAGKSFDDPHYRRTCRVDGQLKDITAQEWAEYEWLDVTSLDDPSDVHVFVKTFKRRGQCHL